MTSAQRNWCIEWETRRWKYTDTEWNRIQFRQEARECIGKAFSEALALLGEERRPDIVQAFIEQGGQRCERARYMRREIKNE